MKKKLEAELISIAHRILKLKNKSDLIQLHQETQKLYEKLSVLRFVEEHFGDAKPTIGQLGTLEKIEAALEAEPQMEEITETLAEPESLSEVAAVVDSPEDIAKTAAEENEPAAENQEEPAADPSDNEQAEQITPEAEEVTPKTGEEPIAAPEKEETETESPITEETAANGDSLFKPAFELSFEPKSEEPKEIKEDAKEEFKSENAQITFEDILGSSYVDPVFVKPEDLEQERHEPAQPDNVIPIGRNFSDSSPVISIHKTEDSKSFSLNDRLSKGITIGLNDRVAFMKHLFNNSSEDYNRVLSQLITFDTYAEAQNFIDNMVKPDYNNWEGKDEYAERFMEIVEKKFS